MLRAKYGKNYNLNFARHYLGPIKLNLVDSNSTFNTIFNLREIKIFKKKKKN